MEVNMAPSGRARCRCGMRIAEGEWRVAATGKGWFPQYYHLSCWLIQYGGKRFLRTLLEGALSPEQLKSMGLEVEGVGADIQ